MRRKIGLLFSLSGTTAIVETWQHQACLLALEQANRDWGLGLEPVSVDIRSDPATAARAAHELLSAQGVDVLVGCYTSACRKALIPVLEETGGTLIYPTVYEGEELHPQIFYFGAVPNQQIDPLLAWTTTVIGDQFILLGSDYIYPRSINRQVRNFVERSGGNVLHEAYYQLGTVDFRGSLQLLGRILRRAHRPVVFSTLVGTSIPAFYQQYRQAGFAPPIVSPITSEVEFGEMGQQAAAGHYFADGHPGWSSGVRHQTLARLFRERFGERPINGIMESSYDAMRFVAHYYRLAGSRHRGPLAARHLGPEANRVAQSASDGRMMVDAQTQHAWLWTRIARVTPEGGVDVLWTSPGPLPPRPVAEEGPREAGVLCLPGPGGEAAFGAMLGSDPRFLECLRVARIAADTPCNVLLTGETGTGKELLARAIHDASPRRRGPFVPLNCAAVPTDLMVSELFGYEGGAFTGSRRGGNPGKFELAHGGTLFLDEIGEMPAEVQAALLRAVQDREIFRIGGTKALRVDVRIIAATNQNIEQERPEGNRFRGDLFYRLNVFHIHLPPLRERKDDIAVIAGHCLARLNLEHGTDKRFAQETLRLFQRHPWPGNIRELCNVVERAYHVSQGSRLLLPEHLPRSLGGAPPQSAENGQGAAPVPLGLPPPRPKAGGASVPMMEAAEIDAIQRAVSLSRYNMSEAARILGISRSTLYRKLDRYGLQVRRGIAPGPGWNGGGARGGRTRAPLWRPLEDAREPIAKPQPAGTRSEPK
ncbi:MAG: hypothetical protein Kow0092_06610 [Deferrisomatales bacterium]